MFLMDTGVSQPLSMCTARTFKPASCASNKVSELSVPPLIPINASWVDLEEFLDLIFLNKLNK